jgi:hypothetical protein
LKIFRPEFARDVALVAKLRRQMQAVATLSRTQPNVVRVYDCDQADDGTLFVVTERLHGQTLREVMRKAGPLEIGRALRFADQMATGLSAAHEVGIVHADIRPENFMILGPGEAVKIIGFERARLKSVGALDRLAPCGIAWVPEYAAPEQIQKREVTHQTDIYAFGVALYEMLTGVVPFRASTPEEVLAMHLNTAPPYPKVLRPEIPVEVEGKVMQALEKEPKWRGNGVTDVVSDLRGFVAVQPLAEAVSVGRTASLADKGPSQPVASTRVRRDHQWTWMVAALAAGLIMIAATALWMLYSAKGPDVAEQPSPPQRPEEAVRPAARKEADVGPPQTTAPPTPPVEVQAPSARMPTEAPPPLSNEKEVREERVERKEMVERKEPVERKEAAPRKRPDPRPPQRVEPSTPSRPAPTPRAESPDPSEVIDWLLRGR